MDENNGQKVPWVLTTKIVVLGLVIFGPLALPLVWMTPKFSWARKIAWTAATVVLTVVLWKYTTVVMSNLSRKIQDLKTMGLS